MKKSPESSSAKSSLRDRSVDEIIASGRHLRPGRFGTCLLSLLSAGLLYCSFTPLDFGPLAWVALVPLLLLMRVKEPTRWMYRLVYLSGFLYWLATLQWMRLGDIYMYFGLLAMSFYLAFYWVLFVGMTRKAVVQFHAPLVITAPVFWVGLEYLRAHLFTGFSWYYLGHTQHHWVEIIQISDVFGSYGVSFIIVLANAAIAQVIPTGVIEWFGLVEKREAPNLILASSRRQQLSGAMASLLIVGVSLGYGYYRRTQSEFVAGPRVSLIQGNFVASLKSDRDQWDEIFSTHRYLTGLTVPYQPDLVLWPEAMFRYPMLVHEPGMSDEELEEVNEYLRAEDWKSQNVQDQLRAMANETNAALCIGINTFSAKPNTFENFNSAVFVQPQAGIKDRYDKIHRVIFGEYIPLKEDLPFIQSLTPFRGDFGIDAGREIHVFKHKDWKLVPLICFEDTVPHLVRQMVQQVGQDPADGVDCLVNMTNDGWFHGSSELEQHLITAKFRCVETRTPMVRAVNTGISAIIDGDGVVRDPDQFIDFDSMRANEQERRYYRDAKTGRFLKQLNCALVGDVPLDKRISLYVSWGDWFGLICLVACLATLIQGLTTRFLHKQKAMTEPQVT